MNLAERQIWQIAAGDSDRNYSDLCLRLGIVMMGPGRQGHFLETAEINARLKRDGISPRMTSMLRRFATEVRQGDIVVLRLGTSEVHGVGVIQSGYGWHPVLMDVDGWDLCHFYHVEWIWAKPEKTPMIFRDALKFGDTLQLLSQSERATELLAWLAALPEGAQQAYVPRPLPECGRTLGIDALCQPLYDYGIGVNNLGGLKDCIAELQALANWYQRYSNQPSEHETVTHLLVPLLKALGWTPQRIALEYHQQGKGRADVALYAYGNRQPEFLTAIVEAKKFGRSCLNAEAQVRSYAAAHTTRLIVTDGIRYGVFVKDGHGPFPAMPTAYLNLTHLVDAYPIYGHDCRGADEALWLMNADWQPGLPQLGKVLPQEKNV